ncbi:MAG: NAD(+)/NADH kinase [Bdellovibrio sp.]|nr:NAD(+)/NADH kinase [Bdellovibrio sp.]
MQKKASHVGIILRPRNSHDLSITLQALFPWLQRRLVKILISEQEKLRVEQLIPGLSGVDFVTEDKLFADADLIIGLGGDGTLLGIARRASETCAPIFGVNVGHMGFIAEFSKNEFYDQLQNTLDGNFRLIQFPTFQAELSKKDVPWFKETFLNDAVISKNAISRPIAFSTYLKSEHIFDMSGDGLIVSSPLGSTAYSLAAGGPIIPPDVEALVLTPICPHGLTHRPLVVSNKEEIIVKLSQISEPVTLTLDGQKAITMDRWDTVTIKKCSNKTISFVKNEKKSYFNTLKDKFYHGIKAK